MNLLFFCSLWLSLFVPARQQLSYGLGRSNTHWPLPATQRVASLRSAPIASPRWAFAYHVGGPVGSYTVVTTVFDLNLIPGASACKSANELNRLVFDYICQVITARFPEHADQYGKNCEVHTVMYNPDPSGNLTCTDMSGPRSVAQQCFITDKAECERLRNDIIEIYKKSPNPIFKFISLFDGAGSADGPGSASTRSPGSLANSSTNARPGGTPAAGRRPAASSAGVPPPGCEGVWNNPQEVFSRGLDYKTGMNNQPVDYALALRCYTRAAELGNSRGTFYLGGAYAYGQGVTQSYCRAFDYYKRAAEAGLPDAMLALGKYYKYGTCPSQQDKALARQWLQKTIAVVTASADASNNYLALKAHDELKDL